MALAAIVGTRHRSDILPPIPTIGDTNPVTTAEVLGWFWDEIPSPTPARRRPNERHVERLVGFLNGFWSKPPSIDGLKDSIWEPEMRAARPHMEILLDLVDKAQVAMEDMVAALPSDRWQGICAEEPEWASLRAALSGIVGSDGSAGQRSERVRPGRPLSGSGTTCAYLAREIVSTLHLAGWKRVSLTTADGPVARVGVKALVRVTTHDLAVESFARSVRRWRERRLRKRGTKLAGVMPRVPLI